MIIVKIFQGPGNQMFQYAYGLAAAKRVDAEFKLDVSWFDENAGHRQYILDRFTLNAEVASQKEIQAVRACDGSNFFEYRFNLFRNRIAPRHRKVLVVEDLSVYDEALKHPYKSSYIDGYFSSEKFFIDYEQEVRDAFQFTEEMTDPVLEIANTIDENTVAFSIRRGDFLGNELHNVCSVQYFERAIEVMKGLVPRLKLLVFSDEIDWIEQNMNFEVPHRFVPKFDDHMNHMRLMSLCKHHIIPNSTFSWWGAWLSKPENVIAPDLWITDDMNVHHAAFGHWVETRHTVPNGWNRISACLEGEELM